jgi:hypothetical protein
MGRRSIGARRTGFRGRMQRWMRWVDRPVVSVVTTQNLRFPYPDPVTDWRTSRWVAGSADVRSAVDLVGVKYWPGY